MSTTTCDVFISYRSTDRALAADLYQRLSAAGFCVWFDVEALDRVGRWHREYNKVRAHSALGYRPPSPAARLAPAEPLSFATVGRPDGLNGKYINGDSEKRLRTS